MIERMLYGDTGLIVADWLLACVCTVAAFGKWWHVANTPAWTPRIARMMLGVAWTMLAARMWVPLVRGQDPVVGALAVLGLTLMAVGSVMLDVWDRPRR